MKNYVSIQLRAFTDYDITGNKVGETSFGFSVFDEYEERSYMDLNQEEFQEILNNPQDILELAMEFFDKDFKAVIISAGGFYIGTNWYRVDSSGRVRSIA